MDRKWELRKAPKLVCDLLEEVQIELSIKEKFFMEDMLEEQDEFKQNMEDIFSIVDELNKFKKLEDCKFVGKKVRDLRLRINAGIDNASTFNEHERLFNKPETDYKALKDCQKTFKPQFDLWDTADKWMTHKVNWLNCKWEDLNAIGMEKDVEVWCRSMAKSGRMMREKGQEEISQICDTIKKQLDGFKPFVPLAVALRTEGMRDRHWSAVEKVTGV